MKRRNGKRKRLNRIKRFGVSLLAMAMLFGDCAYPGWDGSFMRSSLVALAQNDTDAEDTDEVAEAVAEVEAQNDKANEIDDDFAGYVAEETEETSSETQNAIETSTETDEAQEVAETKEEKDTKEDTKEDIKEDIKEDTQEDTEAKETVETKDVTAEKDIDEKQEVTEEKNTDKSEKADTKKGSETRNDDLKIDVLRDGEVNITISTLKDLYIFSEEYEYYADTYSTCNLNIAITESLELLDEKEFVTEDGSEYHYFVPLGTSWEPFRGKITFNVANDMVPIYLQSYLFEYIADSVVFERTSGDGKVTLSLIRTENVAFSGSEQNAIPMEDEALFAQYVVHDSRDGKKPATWRIMASPADAANGYDNSGLFGTVGEMDGDDTVVNVEYISSCVGSSAKMDIKSPYSTGLICGVINQNSKVNVKLSGTNTGYEVRSTNGAVGALVGEMYYGSELNVRLDGFDLSATKDIIGSTYAGGLVGYCEGGKVTIKNADGSADQFYKAQGNIKATGSDSVVGGLFGYYMNIADETMDFSTQYGVDASLYGNTVGGVFGKLENQADLTLTGVLEKESAPYCSINAVMATSGELFGGVVGLCVSDSLSHTIEVTNMQINTAASSNPNVYGGVIGKVDDSNSSSMKPVYLKADNLIHVASQGYTKNNGYFGGVVGDAGNFGSFLDLGNITFSTNGNYFYGGGLVGRIRKGVIRLSGITDLSNAPVCAANDTTNTKNRGQLVAQRGDSLIYALGNGETAAESASYGNGWRFVRSTIDATADDVGTWGEVVRIPGIEEEGGALTFDTTNHKVIVAAAVKSMGTPMDFVKTALNMQFNNGSALGALDFADRANGASSVRSQLLAASDLELTDDIDLAGTGITGLMRDDYLSNADEIGKFTGTFDGNGHTVSLQVGEHYGIYSGSPVVGRGAIFTHRYNGLFARTGTGAVIKEMTVNGTIHVHSKYIDNNVITAVGGVAAVVEDGLSLTDVNISSGTGESDEKLSIVFDAMNAPANGIGRYVGGMIGYVGTGNSANITIGKGDGSADLLIAPVITITGSIGNDEGNTDYHAFGGMIGYIESTKTFTVDISDVVLSATMDGSAVSNSQASIAGLIADICANGTTDSRTLNLTNLTVQGTTVKSGATTNMGGILGYRWNNTNVNMNSVLIKQDNRLVTNASYVAGLVNRGTGHWVLPSGALTITGLTADVGSGTAFGMILLDGYYGSSGVFLDLQETDSYVLASSGVTVPTERTTYDELVAYTASGDNYLNNGCGIVSITTSNYLMSMDGATCNTYQNVYNQTKVNPHARYYYNINFISKKENRTDGEKLLLWSLNRYASDNIKKHFVNEFPKQNNADLITGNFDLVNLSYYPVNVGSAVTLGDVTVKFYNNEIETTEGAASGNTDGNVRSTRSTTDKSQHYLMHSALFKNVSSSVTTTGNLHFLGNVGSNATYSGVFINGTLTGSLSTATNKEIVLEGITMSDPSGYLLIHQVGANTTLILSGVRAGKARKFTDNSSDANEVAYSANATVAKSLIGDITGTGLKVKFTRMQLDARVVENAYNSESNPLNAIYGTTKTLFSEATFMHSFAVDSNSIGEYTFNEREDWSGTTHVGHVTYGWEINKSVQYEDKQYWYYDTENYTSPTTAQSDSGFADFSDKNKFSPYVAVISEADEKREIKVNVKVVGLNTGCGAYNHPYEITSGAQFVAVAKAINGTELPDSLVLPLVNNPNVEEMEHWCENKTHCGEFTHEGDYVYKENGVVIHTWSEEQVRRYLAGAYYMIMNDITITAKMDYPGLGAPSTDGENGDYGFRGVIVGTDTGEGNPCVKITNQTPCKTISGANNKNTYGLITISNGSVVKDLVVEVDLTAVSTENYRASESKLYAYNEEFTSYGAVMNKIMGGDNIIDNVSVQFKRNAQNQVVPFKIVNTKIYFSVVGGYVGSVVNGGLIFRNVTDDDLIDFKVCSCNASGGSVQTDTNLTDGDQLRCLYVNPFVGRVINGYAIRETTGSGAKYSYSENGKYGDNTTRTGAVEVTMHNTGKNFSIPDINKDSENKLTFKQKTGSGAYNLIEIPDSQSMYIMGLIAQSGSGCATADDGNYAYRLSYDGNTQRKYINDATETNHVDTYKATHLATYSDVGTPETNKNNVADYLEAAKDLVNSQKAIPYIIYQYTTSYTNNGKKYPARTLTQRTFFIELAETTYHLPDSFRGIGFLGSNDNKDSMKVYGVKGKGADKTIIDMNSLFYAYQRNNTPYDTAEYANGVALFNLLKTDNGSGNMNYTANSDYHIADFTLSGFASANVRQTNGNRAYGAGQSTTNNNNTNTGFYYSGGLIAYNSQNIPYILSNIMLKDLHVDSSVHAGGLIAKLTKGMVYADDCNADGLTVEGAGRIGGFFGYADTEGNGHGLHINTIAEDSQSLLRNLAVYNHYTYSDSDKMNYTGGVVACFYTNNTEAPSRDNGRIMGALLIRNVTVEGGNPSNSYIGNKESPGGAVGGILGSAENNARGCLLLNCQVKNINLYGRQVGGIIGRAHGTKGNVRVRIADCTVSGDLDANNQVQYKMYALLNSGGIVGYITDNNPDFTGGKSYTLYNPVYDGVEYTAEMDGVSVYGYQVYCLNKSNTTTDSTSNDGGYTLYNRYCAGGLIGYTKYNRRIRNAKVEKCVIEVGGTRGGNIALGGLVGRCEGNLYGYNLLVKDLDFQYHETVNGVVPDDKVWLAYKTDTNDPTEGIRCGNLVGKNDASGNYDLSLVGVHVENCPADYDIREASTTTSQVHVVYADYTGGSAGIGPGKAMSDINPASNIGAGAKGDYFPYVVTNPYTIMGGTSPDQAILTGDGVKVFQSNNAKTVVADGILSDISNNTKNRYKNYRTDDDTTVGTMRTNADPANNLTEEKDVKLTTYESEMALPTGVSDFSILLLGGAAPSAIYTDEITSYIRFLTNTDYDYRGDEPGKYKIEIKACQYVDGKYQVVNEATPGLTRDNSNRYVMNISAADTIQPNSQFSLIDVSFFSPMDENEVAYHLYIPVLTKKMVEFNFRSSAMQGTEYVRSEYTFGNKIAGTFDNWLTTYFEYVYPADELNAVLATGRGLYWSNDKKVNLAYQMTQDVADSTQFVLLDPNSNTDKEFYLEKSAVTTNLPVGSNATDVISLTQFTTMRSGRDQLQEEVHFAPQKLNDIADKLIVYSNSAQAANRVYVVTNDPAEAIAYGYDAQGNNKLYFKKATGSEAAENRYALTATANVSEGYYLSMYAYDEDNVFDLSARTNEAYIFNVECPVSLSGPVTVKRRVHTPATVIIGNLFEQTLTITDLVTDTTMTTVNHTLTATLTSTVSFKESSNTAVFQNILSAADIQLYQGFVVYLKRYDSSENPSDDQLIKGSPQYSYTIENAEHAATGESSTMEDNAAYLYIPPVSITIPEYSATPWSSTQTAQVVFTFDEDDEILQKEFPVREDEEDRSGISFYVSANMAYEEANVSYSGQSVTAEDGNRYHALNQERSELTLIAVDQESDDAYDIKGELSKNRSSLGINAKYIDTGKMYETKGDYQHIDATSNFDVTLLPATILDGSYSLIYTLELSQKQNDNTTTGFKYVRVPIDTYLSDFVLIGKNGYVLTPTSTTGGVYTYKIPLTGDPSGWPVEYANKQFNTKVSFDAKTGAALEAISGYLYSNYKVTMTARIVQTSNEGIGYEGDSDHIIYTNAKVNAAYVNSN